MDAIILSGLPASGKSSVSAALRDALGYPVIEKDRIKECLFDTLGFQSHDEKRRLDAAASRILLQTMETLFDAGQSLIADNNFDTAAGEALDQLLLKYRPRRVTILLSAREDVLYERYVTRDRAGLRHPGHAQQNHYPPLPGEPAITPIDREGFAERYLKRGMGSVTWDSPVIQLDTTVPESVDLPALVLQVRSCLDGQTHN